MPDSPDAGAPRRTRSAARPLMVIGLGVLVVVLSLVAWNNGVEEALFPKEFGVVAQGRVYRSGRLQERMLRKVLDQNQIRTVIDFGGWDPGTPEAAMEASVCAEKDIERHMLPMIGDGRGDPNNYVQALRIMSDPEKQPVLVHCAAGSQRTGAAVLLYRRFIEGRTFDEVFDETLSHGHDPSDNPQLLLYLAEWADDIAESYESGEPIEWEK
jgi:protein tyrosine/serine phosphatase